MKTELKMPREETMPIGKILAQPVLNLSKASPSPGLNLSKASPCASTPTVSSASKGSKIAAIRACPLNIPSPSSYIVKRNIPSKTSNTTKRSAPNPANKRKLDTAPSSSSSRPSKEPRKSTSETSPILRPTINCSIPGLSDSGDDEILLSINMEEGDKTADWAAEMEKVDSAGEKVKEKETVTMDILSGSSPVEATEYTDERNEVPYMAFVCPMGEDDNRRISLADWTEVLTVIDDRIEGQLVDGSHFFDSTGNDWCPSPSDGGMGVGKIACSDEISFKWLEDNLTGFSTKSNCLIGIWGWDAGLPYFVDFFVPKTFRLTKDNMAEGILKFNRLAGKFGRTEVRQITQDGKDGYFYKIYCDKILYEDLLQKNGRLRYLGSSFTFNVGGKEENIQIQDAISDKKQSGPQDCSNWPTKTRPTTSSTAPPYKHFMPAVHRMDPGATTPDNLSDVGDFSTGSESGSAWNNNLPEAQPWAKHSVPRKSRKESNPTWLAQNEKAVLPSGCLPSELFWMLADEDKDFYRDRINQLLGFIPSPYLKPRGRDIPGLRLCRAEREAGINRSPPPLSFPKAATGNIFRANKEDVRKGLKFGKK